MQFIKQVIFGKKASPDEVDALRSYLSSEFQLAAMQTRASDEFNASVARLGTKVLSGEGDDTMRRDMEDAAARYSAVLIDVQSKHAVLEAPEAGADYYAAQQVVYIQHLKWSRAQEVLYQSQGAPHAGELVMEANKRLTADRRNAERPRGRLVSYTGLSRHDVNRMLQEARASEYGTG